MFLKVIACEIAARELYYAAARSRNLVDLEFLTQGYHDTPNAGRTELQKHIDAVSAGKYDAAADASTSPSTSLPAHVRQRPW